MIEPVHVHGADQAADGQWLFLAALDARILLAHYGSYGALPRTVTGRLLEVDAVTQTEAARKKMKFLGHLPLSGGFKVFQMYYCTLKPLA